MICPEICPAPLLSLSKHARKFKKRKKRKWNEEKKRGLIKTRIYNYCISYALLSQRIDHAAKPKSRPIAAKRDGGGVGLPGTNEKKDALTMARL